MKALLPLLFINASLFLTAAIIGGIAFRARHERTPGLLSLLYPFSFIFIVGFWELLFVLSDSLSLDKPFLGIIATAFRALNGLGWFLMCHSQLRLHGKLEWQGRLTVPVICLTVALSLTYALAALNGEDKWLRLAALLFMSATSIYSAISAVVVLRTGIRLWPSSQAGVRMALFGLIAYPVTLIAEFLGVSYPFLEPGKAVYEQMYPFFSTCYALIALPALLSKGKGSLAEPGDMRAVATLTDREKEIARYLKEGMALKEIAIKLGVSLATIKSHANGAYKKLGVSGRKELEHLTI